MSENNNSANNSQGKGDNKGPKDKSDSMPKRDSLKRDHLDEKAEHEKNSGKSAPHVEEKTMERTQRDS